MKQIEMSLKYAIASIIVATNLNDSLTDEEKEIVLNQSFNGLMNCILPEYTEFLLDVILSYSKSYKETENKKLFNQIGWLNNLEN